MASLSTRSILPAKWTAKQTHRFTTARDIRDLLRIEHPWQPSAKDGYGQWSIRVAPPAGWKPGQPLFVSFYQSDNHSGDVKKLFRDSYESWPGWLGGSSANARPPKADSSTARIRKSRPHRLATCPASLLKWQDPRDDTPSTA